MVASLLSSKASQLRSKYLTTVAFQRNVSSKKTAVVVGTSHGGIGEACANRLAEQGFIVVAVGRDRPEQSQRRLVERLMETSDSTYPTASSSCHNERPLPQHEFYPCNAFSLRDVYDTCQKIRKKHPRIDALVMTQGMATTQGFTPTEEGNDQKMTLHYYSRICMILSLLPALSNKNNSRDYCPAVVVSILSGGVHSAYTNYEKDPSLKQSYSIQNAANAAGYYNDLALDHLALNYQDNNNNSIKFVHAAPGFVRTNWGTELPMLLRAIVRFLQRWAAKSPADCAELLMGSTILALQAGDQLPKLPQRPSPPALGSSSSNNNIDNRYNSTSTAAEEEGVYIVNQYGETASLTKHHTPEARRIIWKHTMNVLRQAGVPVPDEQQKKQHEQYRME